VINKTPWATAHGKLIVSGEYSILQGTIALVIPLKNHIKARLVTNIKNKPVYSPHVEFILNVCKEEFSSDYSHFKLELNSTIPQNCGLGSSAALAHAIVQACAQVNRCVLSLSQKITLIQKCETYAHGRPSGLDAVATAYNLPLVVKSIGGELKITDKKTPFFNINNYVLINSGAAKETTKEMVEKSLKKPDFKKICANISKVTNKIIEQLEKGVPPTFLLTTNQRQLETLGVVGSKAKEMINLIESIGGHAKVCGAGGIKGGSGIILAYHQQKNKLLNLTSNHQWEVLQ